MKTQPNLRTQIRLGKDDFIIFGKYINKDNNVKKEVFEKLSMDIIDPNKDLPTINCKDRKVQYKKDDILRRAYDEMKRIQAEKADPKGYKEVTRKRKHASPEEKKTKKDRKFTPEKAGKRIFKIIKLKEKEDTDTESSDEEVSSLEGPIEERIVEVNGQLEVESKEAEEATSLGEAPHVDTISAANHATANFNM